MTQTMQPGYGPQQYPQQGPPPPSGYPQPGYPQQQPQYPQGPPAPAGYQQGPPPPAVPSGPPQGAQGQQAWQQSPQQPPAQQAAPVQAQAANETGDDSFFTGGMGGTYMSFGDDGWIGVERGGEIVGISERQQTDPDTNEPMFWPDGNKIMVKLVTLQTQERADADDKGLRTVWLPASKDITKAVIDAMKQSTPHEMRLHIGGRLFITRTGSRPTTQKSGKKGNPAFTYAARYFPPQRNDQFFAGQQAPPAQNGYQQALVQNQAPPVQNGYQQGAPPAQNGYQQGPPPPAQAAPQGPPPPAQGLPWQQGPPPAPQGNPYAAGPPQPPAGAPVGQPAGPPPQQGWQQVPNTAQGLQQAAGMVAGSDAGYAPNGQPMAAQGYPQSGTDPANPFGGQPQQPVNQSPYQQGPPPPQQYQGYPQQ